MKGTLSAYIDTLTPWIPTDLISDTYLHRIQTISQQLPALSFGCFECWLASDEPRVDFNVAITSKRNEHRTVAKWFTNLPESDSDEQKKVFRKLQSICDAWNDSAFLLHSHIKILWLVYDLPDPSRAVSVPWLYVHFRKNLFSDDPTIRPEIILQSLMMMSDRHFGKEVDHFRSFFESIPPTVQICSIGMPTSRNSHVLRVYLMMCTYSDLLGVLSDNHWPGHINELQQKLHHLLTGCDFFGLSIDITPDLQPRIGIECWFSEAHAQDKLTHFTSNLVEAGLCTTQKREALLQWNGSFETPVSPLLESWLGTTPPATTSTPQRVVIRRMAHYVKLVYEPGKPLVAKGYLYFDRLC